MNDWVRGPVGQTKEMGGPDSGTEPYDARVSHTVPLRRRWNPTYQARRVVHGDASLLTRSMHIALSRRLAAYPRSSYFQEDPGLDLV
ncbi:NADH dehydrogenase subunit 1 [Iris pallida]|uniref:NADH dehydrogenase subunit 1 (Mitochondrion) n=1 Tax=Iris pallida TaxID=29817 RepID=A0AAX6GF03_IRIPA|nr:NADH dehydrogenase subunit 1 [Iris pallida]